MVSVDHLTFNQKPEYDKLRKYLQECISIVEQINQYHLDKETPNSFEESKEQSAGFCQHNESV